MPTALPAAFHASVSWDTNGWPVISLCGMYFEFTTLALFEMYDSSAAYPQDLLLLGVEGGDTRFQLLDMLQGGLLASH